MIDRTHHFNIVGNSVNLKALEVPAKAPWSCPLPSGPVVVFPPTQAAEACGAKKGRAYCAVLVSSQGQVALVIAALPYKFRRMADQPIVEGVVEEAIIFEDPCLHQVCTIALSARHGTFAALLIASQCVHAHASSHPAELAA